MGDGADMALDGIMDYDEMYVNGDFDGPDFQEDGTYYYPAFSSRPHPMIRRGKIKSTTLTCKHCGQSDLIWCQLDTGKWRLHTKDRKIHDCFGKNRPKSL